jgi:predicted transcriptional regulator
MSIDLVKIKQLAKITQELVSELKKSPAAQTLKEGESHFQSYLQTEEGKVFKENFNRIKSIIK